MQFRKDIWRCAIVRHPLAEIIARGSLEDLPLHWLPGSGDLRFLADPFGCWRNGQLHVFAEAFDYRTARGSIDVLTFDDRFRLVGRRPALSEPWHLSYPFVFEAEGQTWLLPEASESGRLTLYRAVDFPVRWAPAHVLTLPEVPIDATPLFHDGRWWLFYTPAGSARDRIGVLHVAFADRLTGPWTAHPANPVRTDVGGARPGGTPYVADGRVVLPVQDCRHGYGGAIRLLRFTALAPDRIAAELGLMLTAPIDAEPYAQGLHTLAAAGPVTLIDVKRRVASFKGLTLRPLRELAALRRRLGGPQR